MCAHTTQSILAGLDWDTALDLGRKTVKGLQMVNRAVSHHGRGNHPCDVAPLSEAAVLEHILVAHSEQLHLDRAANIIFY